MLRFRWILALAVLSMVASASAADRPNFLVFIVDDMAWNDAGCYGHPHIKTPTIDRLAKEGMRFDNAFLTCSSCSPSRTSILTSRYPHNTGAHQLHLPVPVERVLVSQPLRDAGYYTAAAGKWHLGNSVKPQFDLVVEQMNQWVPTLRDRPKDKPFFMWFATTDPHRPYNENTVARPHTAADAVVPPFLPDTKEVREDLADYYDEISRADQDLAAVLGELDRQGIAENTVVVFMSDNGRPFPRCKTTVYDSGVKTPFIVRWPATVKAGSVTGSLVSSIDLAATCCELAGIERPQDFQGRSFAAVLKNPQSEHRERIFAEHNWHDYEARERLVRSAEFAYIRNFYNDLAGTPPADAVRSPTYAKMQEMQESDNLTAEQAAVFAVPRAAEELYDLKKDPFQLHNLIGSSESSSVADQMRQQLELWQNETQDSAPEERRPDGFDRETGERIAATRPNRPDTRQRNSQSNSN